MIMSKKQKTQSFSFAKSPNQKNANLKNSQISISPEKSQKKYVTKQPNEFQQANAKRFIRKSIKKEDIFDPRVYITNQFSYQDVVDLKQVFDTYDSTEMGVLLPNDIKLFLQQNDFNPNKKTVYEIVAEFDVQETGGISFKDFMTAMSTKPYLNETKKQISAIFKKYDKDAKGYINIDDIRQVNRHVKQTLDQETLQLILKRSSSRNDNHITFEDFYAIMVKQIY